MDRKFGDASLAALEPVGESVLVAGQIAGSIQRVLDGRGWNQRRLATEARISPETVSKLLQGRRPDVSVITLLRIQRALNLASVEVLLGGGEGFPSERLAVQLGLPIDLGAEEPKQRPRRRRPLTP